jgi:MFS transporter, AAHS family, 4-hydroxybenzoate transporter
MDRRATVDVAELIDKTPLGWFHVTVLLNTCVVMFMEGYDMQVTSCAAPALIKAWHLTSAYFGPVFGFGLFGYLLGATLLGHLGDRFGRKKVILGGSLFFGAFTLGTAFAASLPQLLFLRFLSGVGIGASIPAASALTVECARAHLKARIISFLFLGYTLGGFAAVKLIPAFGWPSVFVLGGIAPIVLAGVAVFTLLESARFLALRQDHPERVRSILSRFPTGQRFGDATRFFIVEQKLSGRRSDRTEFDRGNDVPHRYSDNRCRLGPWNRADWVDYGAGSWRHLPVDAHSHPIAVSLYGNGRCRMCSLHRTALENLLLSEIRAYSIR